MCRRDVVACYSYVWQQPRKYQEEGREVGREKKKAISDTVNSMEWKWKCFSCGNSKQEEKEAIINFPSWAIMAGLYLVHNTG